jgi:oligosaccharide repeat unit polymerase
VSYVSVLDPSCPGNPKSPDGGCCYTAQMQTGLLLLALFTACLTLGWWKHVETPVRLPLLAHNLPWTIALGVGGSGLILYDQVSVYALCLMGIGILSFNLAIFRGTTSKGETILQKGPQISLLTFKQYVALWLIFLLGAADFLLTINRLFGWRTLLYDPSLVRQYSDVSYLEEFPLWGKLAFYLGPILLAFTMNPRMVSQLSSLPRVVRWLLAAILVAAQSIALQRTNIFVGLILGFALLLFGRFQNGTKRITARSIWRLALGGFAALAIFLIIGGALGNSLESNPAYTPYLSPALRTSPLSSPMFYGSSGPVAFGKLTESNVQSWPALDAAPPVYGDYNPVTWGAASFQAVLKIFPITRLWPQVAPFTSVPMETNVYTWFEAPYRDYRVVGVILFPFLIGRLASYTAIRSSISQGDQLLAALFVTCIVWAPFTNRFIDVMTIEMFILAFWWRNTSHSRERSNLAPDFFAGSMH